VEKILGKEFATALLNECSQIPFESVLTLRTRLAQNVNKVNGERLKIKAYYDLNPVGRSHWTHREFVEKVRPENRSPLADPESRAYLVMNPADNPHLPPEYMEELAGLPERQRQRFLDGKYLSEVPGTLWPIDRLDATRVIDPPDFKRVVVAVDPSGSDGSGGDLQGIIVAAEGVDGHFYVIRDASCRLSPAGWGARACQLYHEFNADVLVAEVNFGGAMVENTIRQHDPNVNFRAVTASRGKHIRAEPVAALYEHVDEAHPAKAHHVGNFPDLEDQLAMFTTEGYQGSGSPDRADALVWALTELALKKGGGLRLTLA
jgi:phage terminase large subunit-like protein